MKSGYGWWFWGKEIIVFDSQCSALLRSGRCLLQDGCGHENVQRKILDGMLLEVSIQSRPFAARPF